MMNTLDETNLRAEYRKLQTDLSELNTMRAQIEERMGVLDEYFTVIQKVKGDVAADVPTRRNTTSLSVEGDTRFSSTRYIAGIVIGSGRGWTKEQIWEAFLEKYGTPGWKNPKNAYSNALARAVDRKLLRQDRGLYYDATA